AGAQRAIQRIDDKCKSARFNMGEHLGEDSSREFGAMHVAEQSPRRAKRLAEVTAQLCGDLPKRLRLSRQLGELVTVVDGTLTSSKMRVLDSPCRTHQLDLRCADIDHHVEASPIARCRVNCAIERDQ